MLNILNKRWVRWLFIFVILLILGFLTGYVIMTVVLYTGSYNNQSFWEILKPF